MRNFITITIFTFISLLSYSQIDKNGNPIFNNEFIENIAVNKFTISMNYYTIENNIDNKNSSVFVSENPTIQEYIKFARNYPSYFAIVTEDNVAKFMLMLLQKNNGSETTFFYNIIDVKTSRSIEATCKVWGEITEKRVDEMIENNYDSTAEKGAIVGTNKRQFSYDKMIYGYQSYDKVKEEIIAISKQLMTPQLTTKKEIREYIKNETVDGELDFNKALEKKEGGLLLYDGIAYNKKDFAFLLWGKKVKILGLKSSKSAIKLMQEIKGKKLTKPEKKALKKGFESE